MTPWPFPGVEPHSAGTVTLDPPWPAPVEERLAGVGRRRSVRAADHYSTLSLEDIAALPVTDVLAGPGHIWCWVTNRILARGDHRDVFKAWGVRPLLPVTWCKADPQGEPDRRGAGRYVRGATEHVILCAYGWHTVPDVAYPASWFTAPRGRHSHKPERFDDIVTAVSPGPYVELFARTPRLGWAHAGLGHELTRQEPA